MSARLPETIVRLLGLLLAAALVCGQPAAEAPPLTVTEVEARLREVEAMPDLDEDTRAAAVARYASALAKLRTAEAYVTEFEQLRLRAEQAPSRLQAALDELAKPRTEVVVVPPPGATLRKIEQLERQAEADRDAARRRLTELEEQARLQEARLGELATEIAEAKVLVERASNAHAAHPTLAPADRPAIIHEAQRVELAAILLAARRTLEHLEHEQTAYDAERDLLPARQDYRRLRSAEAQRRVEAWQEVARQRREEEARLTLEREQALLAQLRDEALRAYAPLRAFADGNAELADLNTTVSSRLDEAKNDLVETTAELEEIGASFRSIRRRIQVVGLNRALRRTLTDLSDELLTGSEHRDRERVLVRQIEQHQLIQIDVDEEREQFIDVEQNVGDLVRSLGTIRPEDREAVENLAGELVQRRRDRLIGLDRELRQLNQRLIDDLQVSRLLAGRTRELRDFIEVNMLWVRSSDHRPRFGEAWKALRWLTHPEYWRAASASAAENVGDKRFRFGTTIVIAALILIFLRLTGRALRRLAEVASDPACARFTPTVAAAVLTLVRAAPLPLILWCIGRALSGADDELVPSAATLVAVAVGEGASAAATFAFMALVLHQTVRPAGLAEAHFAWRSETVRALRRHLTWIIPVVVPLAIVVTAVELIPEDERIDKSLGRFASMASWLAISVFLAVVLRPRGPVLRDYLARHRDGWLARLRWIWYPALVVEPLVLSALAWIGYYFTAQSLDGDVRASQRLLLILILVYALFGRLLLVSQRRLAARISERQRAAEAESEEIPGGRLLRPTLDLPAVAARAKRLVQSGVVIALLVGLYFTWADELPALRVLQRVHLWPSIQVVEARPGITAVADDRPAPADGDLAATTDTARPATDVAVAPPAVVTPDQILQPTEPVAVTTDDIITLGDVLLVIVIIVVTVVATRNVAGLMQMILLPHFPLDASARFALGAMLRYLVVIIGIIAASNTLGISWTSVQWLVAALTFGLAFGLQEIFANFISGLIILFERPIRLGDTVTVNEISGNVTRIRMRATTLRKWDRTEVIIPNKTFITSDVENWTLSDKIIRLTIAVGVAHDTEIPRVRELLLELAGRDDRVLDDPGPQVYFKEVGDQALVLELRVFVATLAHWIPVETAMREAIVETFREAGITIAFPQRDLHVKSVDESAPGTLRK
ncbi:MAG: mechanosensitive ion channel domain-containing protein [Planctomycetota bacterium]|jgi:potassium efflux system protein